MNTALSRIPTSSLAELCNLCYCAARVVTEECGVTLSTPESRNSPSPWEIRILSKLRRCKQDLSCLHEFCSGRLLSQQKVNDLTRRYNLNYRSVEEVCEEVRQTVKALSHRLRRYRHKRSCRQQNRLFLSNQHKFYQQMTCQSASLTPLLRRIHCNFGVICFNKKASWQDTMDQEYAPMAFSQLQHDDFIRALKRIPNWKSPGPDFICGFWIKKFYSLHGAFLHHFNQLLSGSSPLWLSGEQYSLLKTLLKAMFHQITDQLLVYQQYGSFLLAGVT